AGTYALPQKGCVSIDGPEGCGTGPWGNIPDGPNNVYVDPTNMGMSPDGSKQNPVTTIAAALALVKPGGRIALAAGQYKEPVTVTSSLEIDGRCPSQVTIDGSTGDPNVPTVIWAQTGALTLRGVRVSGDGVGVLVSSTQPATIDTVEIDGAMGLGVGALGG